MKYCLIPLGCQMNQSDSERIRTVLEGLGYTATEDEEEAQVLGIVACSVRQRAIDKVYARIKKWNAWKNQKSLLTFVSGCILPADKENFLRQFDLVFEIGELPKLPEMIRQYGVVTPVAGVVPPEAQSDERTGFWQIAPRYGSRFEAFIPIQNGCDKFCTFCAVPYTRGREVSRPSEEILAEVERLVMAGYRSITLLGQNVNSYGLDRQGKELSFARLLREIGELGTRTGREFWVYFTSPHPRDMTDEVLETIAAYPVLAQQIHLPLQSGDDKVLIRMNRNYSLSRYREVVHAIRRILPRATLFTDIIVGFTGEQQENFEQTIQAMREFSYNMAYIAIYSPRPGAASARWDDDVPHEEKKRRLHVLTEELHRSSLAYNQGLLGTTHRVLVEARDRKEGYLSGKTEGRLIVRFPSEEQGLIGGFVEVRISNCASLSLEGELLPAPARREPVGAR